MQSDQNFNNLPLSAIGINDDEPELIPLLTNEDEEQMNNEKMPERSDYFTWKP